MMNHEVVNNEERHRFEVRVEGHLAQVQYRRSGDKITFTHTEVPEALSGKGVGNALAKTALDFARENNLKVVPICPFIRTYIQRHSEYQDLVVQDQ